MFWAEFVLLTSMIGELIRIERKMRNWTQQDLANKTKIKQPVIARYEKGQQPSSKNLLAISKAFNLPVEHFTSTLKINSANDEINFNEIEFDYKLKELKNCPTKYKIALQPIIDFVLNVKRANISLKESQKFLG